MAQALQEIKAGNALACSVATAFWGIPIGSVFGISWTSVIGFLITAAVNIFLYLHRTRVDAQKVREAEARQAAENERNLKAEYERGVLAERNRLLEEQLEEMKSGSHKI